MTLLRLVGRNVRRAPVRSLLTIGGLAATVLGFVLTRTVARSWFRGGEQAAHDRLATRNRLSFFLPLPGAYVDEVERLDGVRAAAGVTWFGGKDPRHPATFFATYAVEPGRILRVYDEVVLTPPERRAWLADPHGAILGDVLARELGVAVGDPVVLRGTLFPGEWRFTVRGVYRAASRAIDRTTFFLHRAYLAEAQPPERRAEVGWIMSRVDQAARSADASAAIDRRFEARAAQTVTMSERALYGAFAATVSGVLGALAALGALLVAVMMLLLGNAVAMGVRERVPEYALLRALGFSPRRIRALVVGEAALLGLCGGALGLLVALPLVALGLGPWIEENLGAWFPYFRVGLATAAAALALPAASGVAAAALSARRAGRVTVLEALRRVG